MEHDAQKPRNGEHGDGPVNKLPVWLPATLAGAVGGFLGFLLAESTVVHWGDGGRGFELVLSTAALTGVLSVPLAAALVVAENLLGLRGKWNRDLTRILIPALFVGAVAGGMAQVFYAWMLQGQSETNSLIRAVAWTLLGTGIGLLLGFNERSLKKALRGMLGGAIGGFIGGLLFNSFLLISLGEGDTGTVSRGVGFTVLGAAIGLMLQVTQDLLKSAWLLGTTTGPYEGKQYILTKNQVTVGRSDANDVSLYHDKTVPLQVGSLKREGGLWFWEGDPILINGQPSGKKALTSGDRLRFGQNDFVFQEKGARAKSDELEEKYLLHSNDQAYSLPSSFSSVILGRQGDVKLNEQGVQDRHAELQVKNGQLYLLAYGPVTLNDQTVLKGSSEAIKAGDIIRLGQVELAVLKER
ncbi:FHA domain-containing protein [Deinococcus cellulosilyticus]|uniref:FHA domain-containing protein n=1 Tax=Deinococcus cellulosilyticus (strain DSM 18568 / NBRC 106333 / KACC 11606 / 5516J-15) TaxID=1223518 RepID=A0A511N2D1_DEIC1|nr:FHA domain-containing protein [Deinococcus cellulosilyticus]GEM46571.1 hypothetical protein DC3_22060 [Deinococcus cellulosilyticus NBRC 106333 = KACC 11606]